jgi:WD40 repeat protein
MHVEPSDSDFERVKWQTEVKFRCQEIRLKEAEQTRLAEEAKRSRLVNPLFLAILGATIAAIGNIVVSWWNGAVSVQTESFRAESARIIEVLHTEDVKKIKDNLNFLADAGLITGETAAKVKHYISHTPVDQLPLVRGVPSVQPPSAIGENVISSSFSPDGKRVVTASADNIARVWDLSGSTPRSALLAGHTASFSPDGRRVVTASTDNTARVWDELNRPTPRSTLLVGHTGRVINASFSPDGKRVVTASSDNTARVWDLSGSTPRSTTLEGHTDSVNSASFSPDGHRVVTASDDNTARVWDLSESTPRSTTLEGHTDSVNSASFSPDGRHVVTASDDKTARVWDLSGPTPSSIVLAGHTGQVNDASFSPDGKRVATASADKTARVWDLSGPTPVSIVLVSSNRKGR